MVIFQSEQYFYSTAIIQHIALSFLLSFTNTIDFCPLIHLAISVPYCFSFLLLPFYKFTVTLTVPFIFYWNIFNF